MARRRNVRLAVYLDAASTLIWPAFVLAVAWQPGINLGWFVFLALLFATLVLTARWDILGYPLPYFFVGGFLFVAFKDGGMFWLADCIFLVAVIWLLLRHAGRPKALELAFPLRGGVFYIAHGGRFRLLNPHRISRAQSGALDIVKLGRWGVRAAGVYPGSLDSYFIFGAEVRSPCAGRIVVAADHLPDLPPAAMDANQPAGNHLMIAVEGSEAYVVLAHLRQGSAQVRVGERVVAGQPLAAVGNSGNTSEPHLHIHAKRGGAEILDGEGVPMRFRGRWLVRNSIVRS